ncbi:hypothetical protein E2C01_093895 [Portunus trituberculatus]|uniref:Uncharacterized protein n=1 Tax=Portunus trituberculatus TaxID=210409 RepID=A0A5B7JR23_PORTR|nr:hypothetical protein [Portunus trituberculatus]
MAILIPFPSAGFHRDPTLPSIRPLRRPDGVKTAVYLTLLWFIAGSCVGWHRNSLGYMAPLGLTGERYISHRATRFGKDSNPGRLDQRPEHEPP